MAQLFIRLVIALGIVVATTHCVEVQPWERGILAKPQMQTNRHTLQDAARTHIQNSREAAPATDVAAGGGCGCY